MPVFVSKIKILNPVIIGYKLLVQVGDMEPELLGVLQSASRGKVTIDFQKGVRLMLKLNRASVPNKLPIILIAENDGVKCLDGINAIDLFNESIRFKQQSSIAQEYSTLRTIEARDVAIASYKLRISVDKIVKSQKQIRKDKAEFEVNNHRAADIFRENQQCHQIIRDLKKQYEFIRSKVDQIAFNQKTQTQVQHKRTKVAPRTQQNIGTMNQQNRAPYQKATTGTRNRPTISFESDIDAKKSKNRVMFSSDNSDEPFDRHSSSNGYNSDGSSDGLISIDSDSNSISKTKKSKKKSKNISNSDSGYSVPDSPVDESFEDVDRFSNSNNSISDAGTISDFDSKKSSKKQKGNNSKRKKSSYSDVDVIDSSGSFRSTKGSTKKKSGSKSRSNHSSLSISSSSKNKKKQSSSQSDSSPIHINDAKSSDNFRRSSNSSSSGSLVLVSDDQKSFITSSSSSKKKSLKNEKKSSNSGSFSDNSSQGKGNFSADFSSNSDTKSKGNKTDSSVDDVFADDDKKDKHQSDPAPQTVNHSSSSSIKRKNSNKGNSDDKKPPQFNDPFGTYSSGESM